jgi:hypothetical protein
LLATRFPERLSPSPQSFHLLVVETHFT